MSQDIMWAFGRPKRTATRTRHGYFDLAIDPPVCHLCAQPLEACACVCPYCGERNGCLCCIGFGLATGGG